ncbi:hypothetical protein EMIHUDRAFT_448425 [Emiliania huxleyi CCMP1516]|uniref:Protein kinase domain-containing protein n=2 Tax=Emiliania huxleyi TaxID=2903 RepID=A0A0D3IEC5_EMIH1|nr:hypothetical protein EMIHUDRAFT_448425 [Emiliania huxleyi CCMP1516]EOD09610.1 hypothetical protein EMIHUDRAFT_448425 [Emiliania huxleyi CCMP1516]|eukprot:XP_005762039.1 hypothetical protein EMIHUDRAFT_448425 [Emiliania huxleyi CCMP1516]
MGDNVRALLEGAQEGTVWECGAQQYVLEKVVGNGAFGIVWRARSADGEVVAIKKALLSRTRRLALGLSWLVEHEHIIRLRCFFEKSGRRKDETYLHLVMDYLPETLRGLVLQHNKRRRRFDIGHPDNLLVDPSTLQCKLCDFGCSKTLVAGTPNVSYICSRYYRAPELLFGASEYSVAVDVWSVGTILVELLLGHLPFQGQDSTQQHLDELRSMNSSLTADELPKLKPFPWDRIFPTSTEPLAAQQLLCYDPARRLDAAATLAHPFFADGKVLPLSDGGSGSPTTPVGARGASSPKGVAAAAEWEGRLRRYYTALASRACELEQVPAVLERRLKRAAQKGLDEARLPEVAVEIAHEEIAAVLRDRDEAVQGVHRRLLFEAGQLQVELPLVTPDSAAASAAADAEAASLLQQLTDVRKAAEASAGVAAAEKARLLALINEAREQLAAPPATPDPAASPADVLMGGVRRTSLTSGGVGAAAARIGGAAAASPVCPRGDPSPGGLPIRVQTDHFGSVTPAGGK